MVLNHKQQQQQQQQQHDLRWNKRDRSIQTYPYQHRSYLEHIVYLFKTLLQKQQQHQSTTFEDPNNRDMSIMIEQMHPPLPAYELDSVADDKLEALIRTLGLKAHVQNSYDPCCVICRQNMLLTKSHHPQQMLRHQFTPAVATGVVAEQQPVAGNFHHPNGYYHHQQNR